MARTTWHQRLEEARRTIEQLTRAAHAASNGQPRASNIRVASHRNVKVVGNFGHAHASQMAFAHQVAPIHQEHHSEDTTEGASSAATQGGEARHDTKEE